MKTDIYTNSGIYYPSDIQLILKLNKQNTSNWIKNYYHAMDLKIGRQRAINFYMLIELYVINKLLKVMSHKQIKEQYKLLSKSMLYPFARKEIYYFNEKIYIKEKNKYLCADSNFSIDDIIDEFSSKISYSSDGLSEEFYPLTKNSHIVVNPHIQAGEPVIKGTRIPVENIYEMLKNNESIENICFYYQLQPEIIEEVKKFYN